MCALGTLMLLCVCEECLSLFGLQAAHVIGQFCINVGRREATDTTQRRRRGSSSSSSTITKFGSAERLLIQQKKRTTSHGPQWSFGRLKVGGWAPQTSWNFDHLINCAMRDRHKLNRYTRAAEVKQIPLRIPSNSICWLLRAGRRPSAT